MTPADEKAALDIALVGICAAPIFGVAMAVGGIAQIPWLLAIGGGGLVVIALLGPAMAFGALLGVLSDD